jgi:hypothetical protein
MPSATTKASVAYLSDWVWRMKRPPSEFETLSVKGDCIPDLWIVVLRALITVGPTVAIPRTLNEPQFHLVSFDYVVSPTKSESGVR